MNPKDCFVSCDWGTSNFRLKVVKYDTLEVLEERVTSSGVKPIYSDFQAQEELSQEQFFANYLKSQVLTLSPQYQKSLIIISGMASANIGLCELEYAELPLCTDGSNVHFRRMTLSNEVDILLISGAKDHQGMMRGEETQAIGLAKSFSGDGVLILPGTHSKHLTYQDDTFSSIRTYMTGELFELLSKKSILHDNVQKAPFTEENQRSFREGVLLGQKGELTSALFAIRARSLLHNKPKAQNFFLLSGMLIGDELTSLDENTDTVYLAAPPSLMELYQMALGIMHESIALKVYEGSEVEKALLIGKKKILDQYVKQQ